MKLFLIFIHERVTVCCNCKAPFIPLFHCIGNHFVGRNMMALDC